MVLERWATTTPCEATYAPPLTSAAQKRPLLVLTVETCAQKHDPWEGGVRTTAFISGGFVPAQLRGTTSGAKFVHISDWWVPSSTVVATAAAQDIC